MNTLRLETLTIPAAALGDDNPFPSLIASTGANAPMKVSPEIPEEDRRHFGYGASRAILPYGIQDQYNREPSPREFKAVVLENEILRATFLPEIGGRLWSLYHKPAERELLYVNPIFQPANLALRNAWFSGGVEWNMSIIGHHPFTCAPLHTARLTDEAGNPVLRMYEWERLRGLLFQIDASLPAGSPVLQVRVRLVNTAGKEIPSYWFSNIAVPEVAGHRVLAPADWAMSFGYSGGLERVPVPINRQGLDISYPTNIPSSNDFFFRVPNGTRPWIAALDENGRGLFQTSTSRLRGRKLFVWGMEAGGRHWQDFLTQPGNPYVEIQAGLGRTQAECVPMPAGSDWSWVEAYGLLEGEPSAVHHTNWAEATRYVAGQIEALAPDAALEARLQQTALLAQTAPEEILLLGSGWGALENTRRAKAGQPPLGGAGTPFPKESLNAEQAAWLTLLETGEFPETPCHHGGSSWAIEPHWLEPLEQAPENAARSLHLGVLHYAAGRVAQAREAWEKSIALAPSVVALRNLAVVAAQEGRSSERLALIRQAFNLAPNLLPAAVECLRAHLEENQPGEVVKLYGILSPELQANGRLTLIYAQALLEIGDLKTLRPIIESEWIVTDLKEGDNALTDLWFTYHEKRLTAEPGEKPDDIPYWVRLHLPPPPRFEYRMRITPPQPTPV